MAATSPLVWHEANARDGGRAKDFYSRLLGWDTTDLDMGPGGTYTFFRQNGDATGGIVRMKGSPWEGQPPHWSVYVHVPDVDECAPRAADLGGSVPVPPFDVPKFGRTCVVLDPEGASFYLFTPAKH